MDDEQRLVKPVRVIREDRFLEISVGQWYWVTSGSYDLPKGQTHTWLGCVTEVGSNYAELQSIPNKDNGYSSIRVHFKDWEQTCLLEPNAQEVIQAKVTEYKGNVEQLMHQVQQLTSSLGLDPRSQIGEHEDQTQAISVRATQQAVDDYKTALISAKTEQLPDLFKQIEKNNQQMASWMKAPLIGLKAEADGLKEVTKKIDSRIFNVELYAGLVENVTKIKDGEPAGIAEPIYLFQRMAYMDEECLAHYETGGMAFGHLAEFDAWLIKPENLSRLFPYQRCLVPFRVRRFIKQRDATDFRSYIRIKFEEEQSDKFTYLYIRNGEQVYRMYTGIEFDERLFPDVERSTLDGVIYARMYSSDKVNNIISQSEYEGLKEDYQAARKEHADRIRDLRKRGVPKEEWWRDPGFHFSHRHGGPSERDYHGDFFEWNQDTVYYDDIKAYVQKQMDEHNRVVLILQGLLDRSPVFHPHPPYQLWNFESFNQAIRLVYDDSRALVAGPKPDLVGYLRQLNKNLKVGCVTIGQQAQFEFKEAEKENDRRERARWRYGGDRYEVTRFKPYGNPGPGVLARVQRLTRQGCTYTWFRARQTDSTPYWSNQKGGMVVPGTGPIKCQITVASHLVMNVNAYTPGDYKIFYNDPRTRAEYLQWAPLFLEAEEYYAGNRKVGGEEE